MKPLTTLQEDLQRYRPVLILDALLSRQNLSRLRITFLGVTLLGSAAYLATFAGVLDLPPTPLLLGTVLAFGLWVEQLLLYSYHNHFYFHGLNSILGLATHPASGATYEVATALASYPHDVTAGFCLSPLGKTILLRSGIAEETIETFLGSSRTHLTTDQITLQPTVVCSLVSVGEHLLTHDLSFKKFIKEQGVTEDVLRATMSWVLLAHHQSKKVTRWWGRDNLSQIQGLGQAWSNGTPYLLERYTRPLAHNALYRNTTPIHNVFSTATLSTLEVTLAGSKAANVLLIGETGVGSIDLLLELLDRQQRGASVGTLTGTRMLLLDTGRLFASHPAKHDLENTLHTLFLEAFEAGNITIIIENISQVILEAESLGVALPELLDQFLASPELHIIATDTPSAYHQHLQKRRGFTHRFTEILLAAPNVETTIHILQGLALVEENSTALLYTYPALMAIAESADRYIVAGVMPEKAITLLQEISVRAKQTQTNLITADFVYAAITEKTGIPVGEVTATERDVLLHLEAKLHERVIGQDEALRSIARTMRRARVGIQSAEKPIGSFLFLGPTGVGKTETAKALAFIFFGSEEKMHRLDMSEFSGNDALIKLLGDETIPGLLPNMLRDHPYAVLLLDEFEKANRAVHDLFLQILDEGRFTDGSGELVNARNIIFVATSNAGSDLIIKTITQRKKLNTLAEEIISHLITNGTYRPELLNRFDSTIIFEPLTREEQAAVANLLLQNLYTRLQARGYGLTLSPELMQLIVEKGYSPDFGARPMQRVLQDMIEEKVATRILEGTVQPGDTITLTIEDFS